MFVFVVAVVVVVSVPMSSNHGSMDCTEWNEETNNKTKFNAAVLNSLSCIFSPYVLEYPGKPLFAQKCRKLDYMYINSFKIDVIFFKIKERIGCETAARFS